MSETTVTKKHICANPEECCRELSRVWEALGVSSYDGRSCHEHVTDLRRAASRHFNGLSPAEAERLALLLEELGEAQQVIGKILRHGYESRNPDERDGPTNRMMLEKEIADVHVAGEMLLTAGDLRESRAWAHVDAKRAKLPRYLHHQAAVTGVAVSASADVQEAR